MTQIPTTVSGPIPLERRSESGRGLPVGPLTDQAGGPFGGQAAPPSDTGWSRAWEDAKRAGNRAAPDRAAPDGAGGADAGAQAVRVSAVTGQALTGPTSRERLPALDAMQDALLPGDPAETVPTVNPAGPDRGTVVAVAEAPLAGAMPTAADSRPVPPEAALASATAATAAGLRMPAGSQTGTRGDATVDPTGSADAGQGAPLQDRAPAAKPIAGSLPRPPVVARGQALGQSLGQSLGPLDPGETESRTAGASRAGSSAAATVQGAAANRPVVSGNPVEGDAVSPAVRGPGPEAIARQPPAGAIDPPQTPRTDPDAAAAVPGSGRDRFINVAANPPSAEGRDVGRPPDGSQPTRADPDGKAVLSAAAAGALAGGPADGTRPPADDPAGPRPSKARGEVADGAGATAPSAAARDAGSRIGTGVPQSAAALPAVPPASDPGDRPGPGDGAPERDGARAPSAGLFPQDRASRPTPVADAGSGHPARFGDPGSLAGRPDGWGVTGADAQVAAGALSGRGSAATPGRSAVRTDAPPATAASPPVEPARQDRKVTAPGAAHPAPAAFSPAPPAIAPTGQTMAVRLTSVGDVPILAPEGAGIGLGAVPSVAAHAASPLPVAAAAPPGADPRAVAAQLAEAFVSALPDGAVEIALDPVELGRVRLVLSPDGAAMSVYLSAERPDTLELMRRAIDTLAGDLRELGYGTLNFRFDQSGDPPRRPGRDGAADRATATADPRNDAPATVARPSGFANLSSGGSQRLDIRL